jgi:hypothetical protein
MVIWSILDKCNFILDRTGGPGLAGPEIPNFWAVECSSAARYSPCHPSHCFQSTYGGGDCRVVVVGGSGSI